MSVNIYDKTNDALNLVAGGTFTFYADAPVGSIIPYGGTTAPNGWLLCKGQAVSCTTYAELFAVIGIAFGAGDGSTTFNVPDLRETAPVGTGTRGGGVTTHDIYALGQFKDDQLQNHTHTTTSTGRIDQTYTASAGHLGYGDVLTATGLYDSTAVGQYIYTKSISVTGTSGNPSSNRRGGLTRGKRLGVNYIIKAKHVPVPTDFMNVIDEAVNGCEILPYNLNHSSNLSTFNRKWLVEGSPITWTATHTGRLTVRLIKHGDGYSLYLKNHDDVMLDSYDNFLGDENHGTDVVQTSITLQAWVRKGDVIILTTNLPANTDYADRYFVQTALLLYNDNFD